MRNILFAFAFFLGFFLSFGLAAADECGQVPTDHCTISQSTTFTPGAYQVENLTVTANNTLIDCNGASFATSTENKWLFEVGGTRGVTIQNCYATGYQYGVTNLNVGSTHYLTKLPVHTLTVRDNSFDNVAFPVALSNFVLGYTPSVVFPNHQIINNTMTNVDVGGISLRKTENNYLADNLIERPAATPCGSCEGIVLEGAENSVIERNTLHSAKIDLQRFGNWNSTNVTVTENNITDVYRAIHLDQGSNGALVQDNSLERVGLGVYIRSNGHVIRHNTMTGEESLGDGGSMGVFVETDSVPHRDNTIALNIFENMSEPAYDSGVDNNWSVDVDQGPEVTMFGNFYDIYHEDTQIINGNQCTDINFDNICDDPYPFNIVEEDDFPLRSRSLTETSGLSNNFNAPTVAPVADIFADELDQVQVVITAASPINAPLTYTIKNAQGQVDPRFAPAAGSPNVLIWNTSLFDAGNYSFLAVATDNQELNHGAPFSVYLSESDSDCGLYLPNVVDGCEVRSSIVFTPGAYLVPHGISVTGDNLVLDCNGAVLINEEPILYNPLPNPGISVINRQNVEIKNCVTQRNSIGLLVDQSNNIRVHDSVFNESLGDAVSLINSQNIYFEENIASNSAGGIRLMSTSNSHLVRNTVLNNRNLQIDIMGSSSNNNITENTIKSSDLNNLGTPMRITYTTQNNLIYRNNFILPSGVNGYPTDSGINTQWTVNGEGNYWTHHLCINNNWDTRCENAYSIRFGYFDTAPFSIANGWERPYPQITVSTTTPQQGQPMTIQLVDPDMAGKRYLVVADIFPGTLSMGDGRVINLAGSGVFFAMITNPHTLGFSFSGVYDQNGVATITWNIPQIPGVSLSGIPVYFNLLPFNPNLVYPQAILRTYRSPGVIIQ